MKIVFRQVYLILLMFGCADHEITGESACGVANPTVDLPWLKAEIENGNYDVQNQYADYSIIKASYLGKTVFYTQICCPLCNTIPPYVKNCKGETVGQLNVTIDRSELQNESTIWRTHNGVCP
jgi:hypothetical protein